MTVRRLAAICLAMACILAIPGVAHAQTQLRGVVKDSTGGALPGVTVEAKSDVLIEGAKSAITDGEGQYTVTDLRPGRYVVTFTLQGFQTLTNKEIVVTADVTTTVNADMKLGSRGEELTITGAAATVDVQNATKITTLERSVLDNLPIGNNIWEMAQMIPQIDMYSDFSHRSSSVGGSLGAVQNYMSVNGQLASNNVVMVDGMSVSGLELNGTMQAYFNNDMNSEVSYQTSGISADRSGGGVTVNMIPREGGNRFSGDLKTTFRPEGSFWIADNLTDRLKAMGDNSKSSLKYLEDETISQGGPILRNKLWFFGSWHQFRSSDFQPNVFFNDRSQYSNDGTTRQGSGRLTYQATPRVKLSGYYDRTEKHEGLTNDFDDPETALYFRSSPNYSTGNIKLTSTLTSRLLLEGGYSMNREWRTDSGMPEFTFARDTAEWYDYVSRRSVTGGVVNSYGTCGECRTWPGRDNYQGSLSYVTGAHQMKVGVQLQQGSLLSSNDGNGDTYAIYSSSAPASCPGGGNCRNIALVPDPTGIEFQMTGPLQITAFNTPRQSVARLNRDLGIYFQDSYRFKRLTVNPGLRWEHVNSQEDAGSLPEGRWVPRRTTKGVRNTPDWFDWAPRFNAVWDVFGNARTAVKYSLNRYNQAEATGTAQSFDVLGIQQRTIPWTDKNKNDIPDGRPGFVYDANGVPSLGAGYAACQAANYADPNDPCELNMTAAGAIPPTNGVLFGTPGSEAQYVGYPRSWLLENIVEVQHALTRRLSVTASWTRSEGKDLTKTVNPQVQPGDFTPLTVFNPIDGTPMTYWTIKDAATQTRLANTTGNISYVEPNRRQVNQTYSLEFRMRPFAGAQIFGGFTAQRFEGVNCDPSVAGYLVNPNTLRYCDSFNLSAVDDHGIFDSDRTGTVAGYNIVGFTPLPGGPVADQGGRTPLAKDFRIGLSLPLPWYGINLGVSYLNNDEGSFSVVDPVQFTVTNANSTFNSTTCGGGTTRYPDGLTGCNVDGVTITPVSPIIQGASNTRKVAITPAPACNRTYGCQPGAAVVTPTTLGSAIVLSNTFGASGTFSRELFPAGRLRRERLNQFDVKVSKTFRIKRLSILPTIEAANIFNQDKINAVASASYAATATGNGSYAVPSGILQSRIIGFGVQVRW